MSGRSRLGVWLYVAFRYRAAIRTGIERGALRHRALQMVAYLNSAKWREIKRSAQWVTYRAEP